MNHGTRQMQTGDAHRLSEQQLLAIADKLADRTDFEGAIEQVILLVWGIANQSEQVDCRDMADAVIERLYRETRDCGAAKARYLHRRLCDLSPQ